MGPGKRSMAAWGMFTRSRSSWSPRSPKRAKLGTALGRSLNGGFGYQAFGSGTMNAQIQVDLELVEWMGWLVRRALGQILAVLGQLKMHKLRSPIAISGKQCTSKFIMCFFSHHAILIYLNVSNPRNFHSIFSAFHQQCMVGVWCHQVPLAGTGTGRIPGTGRRWV